jgi:hypothetical protein
MKLFKYAALVAGVVLPLAAAVAPASAETITYDWVLSGPAAGLGGVPYPGSGTVTATLTGGNWVADAATGTINGSAVTGVTSFDGTDNLLFPTGLTYLDTKGIAFQTAAGQIVDIFSFFAQGSQPSGNAYGELASNPGGFGVGTFTLTAAVPEPSTWAMLILGFVGLGFLGYRRSKTSAAMTVA